MVTWLWGGRIVNRLKPLKTAMGGYRDDVSKLRAVEVEKEKSHEILELIVIGACLSVYVIERHVVETVY